MSFFEDSLVGKTIDRVYVDSEVVYLILSDGTHVAIRGFVLVERARADSVLSGADTLAVS
jgi:hypothetical protein